MDNSRQMNNNTIEIDLRDLAWRLVGQWKAILMFSIIMAVIAMFIGFHKDQKNFENYKKEKSETENLQLSAADQQYFKDNYGEAAVQILENLDESDRIPVMNVLRLDKLLEEQREYLSDSLYMNLNPDRVRQLTVGYIVRCKEEKDEKYLDILLKEYQKLYVDNNFLQCIKTGMDLDVDDAYISELIKIETDVSLSSTEKAGVDSFYINISIPESVKEVSGIKQQLDEYIKIANAGISEKIVPHTLEEFKTIESIINNSSLVVAKTDMLNRIAYMGNYAKAGKDGLQGIQKTAYDMITEMTSNHGEVKAKELPLEQELYGLSAPHYRKKYALLGLIMGVILYFGIYLVLFIFSGKYHSSNTIKIITGSGLLGQIHLENRQRGFAILFTSPFIDRIRNRHRGDTMEETEAVITEILAGCRYNDISNLTLIECGSILENCKKNNLQIVDRLCNNGYSCDCRSTRELGTNDYMDISGAVIVIQKDQTITNEIKALCNKISYYKMANLGIIYYD